MSSSNRNTERERFYLLPGMGGRAYRRKQEFILKAALLAALAISGILAVILYCINSGHR